VNGNLRKVKSLSELAQVRFTPYNQGYRMIHFENERIKHRA
jgi:hypothetical protein